MDAPAAVYRKAFDAVAAKRARQLRGLDLAKASIPYANYDTQAKSSTSAVDHALMQALVQYSGGPANFWWRFVNERQLGGSPDRFKSEQGIYGN